VHVLSSHPVMRADVGTGGMVRVVFDFLKSAVINRARCHCPTLSTSTLNRLFSLTSENVLYGFQGISAALRTELAASCPSMAVSFLNFSSWFSAAFPGTCNASTYSTAGCLAKWRPTHPALSDVQLQVAMRECPAGGLPYVSLSCNGPFCAQFLKPCHTNADW